MFRPLAFRRLLPFVLLSSLVAALLLLDGSQAQPARKPAPKDWGKEISNSIGMKLVRIPAGKFMMGSTKEDQDEAIADYGKHPGNAGGVVRASFRTEGPRHQVEITKDFYLGMYEVTQKQYQTVMGKNPSKVWPGSGGEDKAGRGGKDKVKDVDSDDLPVDNVTWGEAVAFCKKLSELPAEKRAGRTYRLPTEAEWEYACRAGTKTPFHFGVSLSSKQANFHGAFPYGEADPIPPLARTCKVGSYKPNAWGLYDMHGNVWEWCSDWHGKDYYGKSPRRDPQGPSEGSLRVVRGGSWRNYAHFCRSAHRGALAPSGRDSYLGFRVALVSAGR
jgi:formylglycine-generating enzyme required for sulfatase activity